MNRRAIGLTMVLVMVAWGLTAYGTATVVTAGGSVLSGEIESGLPAAVSVTSETGDVFTVQRANMKHVRFGEERKVTVETFDGNIIVGTMGGISDVFGLRTEGGDVQSLSVDSIVEMRFEPVKPSAAEPTSLQPVPPPVGEPAGVAAVIEAYEDRSGSFTLGIDSGLQLGFSMKNGFGLPRFTVGVNGILLGAVGRLYFPPSVRRVERIARGLIDDGVGDRDTLLEQTQAAATPLLLPYAQLGTDMFIIPHIGGGVLLRLGRLVYFDLGGTLDTVGVPWPSVGLLIFF